MLGALRRLPIGAVILTAGVLTPQANAMASSATRVPVSSPTVTVSGTVADASGHGWPLYATVTAQGVSNGTVYTNPVSGRYSIVLPASATYSLHVAANYPGYLPVDQSLHVGTGDVARNFHLGVDRASCSAPGYAPHFQGSGLYQPFDSGVTPPGWSVVDNAGTGQVWQFNDPGGRGNLTGGTGGFAIVDSDHYGIGGSQDTSLVSPSVNMTTFTAPQIGFYTDYRALNDVADVDLSVDGGTTWANVWHQTSDVRGPVHEQIAIPQAAGKAGVKVRFHYYNGSFAWWWEVDDVTIGQGQVVCAPIHGGLVMGRVTDANTGAALDGATVTSSDNPADTGVTTPQPNDPTIGHGWYWLFSHLTGSHPFTASLGSYQTATRQVNVATNSTTRANFTLNSGHLVITPSSITVTQTMGQKREVPETITNDGTAPADMQILEQGGNFQIRGPLGAKVRNIRGYFTPNRLSAPLGKRSAPGAGVTHPPAPSDAPWTAIANYPSPIMDNAAATAIDGRVYSVGGFDGSVTLASAAVFTPGTGAWTPIAPMSNQREKPSAAFINGKLYVVGGWGSDGNPVAALEVYDPATGSWSTGASIPTPYAGSGVVVLGGKLYVVGGCDSLACGHSDVFVYDPTSNAWSTVAPYPNSTSWLACGGITGKIYCAGGTDASSDTASAFVYTPTANAWSPVASLPIDLWAMGYTAANGALLVSGGVTNGASTITNMGFSYDPVANSWSAIPNSNNTVYRGGSACGFYKVGGSTGAFNAIPNSELLPGFGQCGGATNVPWLSEHPTHATLQPGQSVTVEVTVDASVAAVNQPGTYTAQLVVNANTPASYAPVNVTMRVTPLRTWGKITGVVMALACRGPSAPLPGATVQINSWASSYTLQTDASGEYELWLDVRNNPLTLIVAKDGFQPQTTTARISALTTTRVNFNLKPAGC